MAQLILTDAASLSWDISVDDTALLTATAGVGDVRTLPNTILSNGTNGVNYQLTFVQDGTGGREISFQNDYSVIGKFNKAPNARTIITFIVQGGKADVVLSSLIDDNIGERDFVASGAISAGVVVGLRSDGKVEIITDDIVSEDFGTPVEFDTGLIDQDDWLASVYDNVNNNIIIAYADGAEGNKGYCVIGKVSGSSISFGTRVQFSNTLVDYISITFDSFNDRVVIAYFDDTNNFGKAIVGTVSGTSISFGTAVTFESAVISHTAITFDSSNNKVVIAYTDNGNSNFGTAIIGTVSDTAISFGTAVVYQSSNSAHNSIVFDTINNKVVVAYGDSSTGWKGFAKVGTVSGTSISFGSISEFENSESQYMAIVFDDFNEKVVIAYQDNGTSNQGAVIVGTVSGTSISFGTKVVFNTGATFYNQIAFDSLNNKILITYRDGGNSNFGTFILGTVSGTSISFDTETVYYSNAIFYESPIVFDISNGKAVISYAKSDDTYDGESFVYSPEIIITNVLTTIGIASEAISDTNTGTITVIAGTNDQQSGLTPGVLYYVQYDGVITATPDDGFDSVELGFAVSATEILLKN